MSITQDPTRYAERLLGEAGPAPQEAWDERTHFRGADDETIAYVITLDAINFGSGYFPHLEKRPGHSGYFTIALSLKERFEEKGPLGARELMTIDRDAAAELFGQPPGEPVRDELMGQFAAALAQLGSFVERNFSGSFTRLVEVADASAEGLAAILAGMSFFRDVSHYRGRSVPFLKRAQITASDLALALDGRPPANFTDLDRLTIFADNLVPHVLRLDGILEYAPELVERLERGEPLEAGSEEEVEIRACAVHAVEQMVAGLQRSGRQVSARELDLIIWNRGQASRYRGGSKHRTRTVYY
ncbi:MAG TPA: queuosine salvage family protein [Trueperaceae bacterium]